MQNPDTESISTLPEVAEYRAFREQLSKPLAISAQLERLLADKRDAIDRAREAIPDLSELLAKREDLLAERAIGGAVDAEIAAIDAEIARLEQIADAAQEPIVSEEQAIAGLQRRLDRVNQEVAELTAGDRENKLIGAVLAHHAHVLAGEYASVAIQMKSIVMRLFATDKLYAKHTGEHLGHDGFGPFGNDFEIAICRLDAATPHEGRGSPGPYRFFVVRALETHEWNAAMEAEREILRKAGLDSV